MFTCLTELSVASKNRARPLNQGGAMNKVTLDVGVVKGFTTRFCGEMLHERRPARPKFIKGRGRRSGSSDPGLPLNCVQASGRGGRPSGRPYGQPTPTVPRSILATDGHRWDTEAGARHASPLHGPLPGWGGTCIPFPASRHGGTDPKIAKQTQIRLAQYPSGSPAASTSTHVWPRLKAISLPAAS